VPLLYWELRRRQEAVGQEPAVDTRKVA